MLCLVLQEYRRLMTTYCAKTCQLCAAAADAAGQCVDLYDQCPSKANVCTVTVSDLFST